MGVSSPVAVPAGMKPQPCKSLRPVGRPLHPGPAGFGLMKPDPQGTV